MASKALYGLPDPSVPAPTHPNHSCPHSIPATLAFSLFLQIANRIPPTSWLCTCCALGYKYISQLISWLASSLQVSVNITSSETPFPNRPIYNSPRPTHSAFSPVLCTTTLFIFLTYHHLTYSVFTFLGYLLSTSPHQNIKQDILGFVHWCIPSVQDTIWHIEYL